MVQCATHGEADATIVCCHIAETLTDGVARGFRWSLDQDDEYQATCDECSDLSDDEWLRIEVEVGRVLCFGCFKRAATLNGVQIEKFH